MKKHAQQRFQPVPFYISDDKIAEKIGAIIASEFQLKRSSQYPDRWETASGTFTNIGIARRAHRIIQEGVSDLTK